jgi:recombinational DNA repair protein RecT
MGNLQITVAELNKMKAFDILESEAVRTRFIEKYNQIHNSEDGEMFYESEKYNFQKLLANSKDLKECTGFSIYGILMDISAMGLTITPDTKPLLYVLSRSVNVGTQNSAVWEKRAYIQISPYGELALRIQANQILYADRPVVVYEGDTFQPGMNEYGRKFVKYMASVPRKSKNIIGSFIGLTRPDNSIDFFWMMDEEIERLKKASNKQNKGGNDNGKANALYTANDGQIDIGFLEAKTLKHSLMTFPKIKIGQFTTLQQFADEPKPGDYGISAADMKEFSNSKPEIESFAEDKTEPIAATVEIEDEHF